MKSPYPKITGSRTSEDALLDTIQSALEYFIMLGGFLVLLVTLGYCLADNIPW